MTSDRSTEIQWQEWGESAFEQANEQDKLIILDIGASWCHWCHVMDRTTYSDPEVIEIVNEKFIPIRVDADKRPDIQDSYLLGGWPTTAFLLPDGRIMSGTTFIPPDAMVNKLIEAERLYREHKPLVTMQVTSMAAEAEAKRTEAETPKPEMESKIFDDISKSLKRSFDNTNGGFGTEPKFPYPDALRFAFLQYRKTHDEQMLEMARKTLDGMMGLLDTVWGGFYRYSVKSSWKEPHFEKMLYVQAYMMDNYLEGYQVTGDDRYGEVAAEIKSYLTRFLSDQENGGFYGSQDADVNSHDPDLPLIPGEEYYLKSEDERLALGIPHIDKTIYTDWNGQMISSYLKMYHVMGDKHALDFAIKTTERILRDNLSEEKMCHYFDGEAHLPGILSDQVYFAQALIDVYQTSGNRKYLDIAKALADFTVANLQDVLYGGFYYRLDQPHAVGELSERHKPFDENIAAAQLFTELHYLTGRKDYRDMAERTLKAIAYPQLVDNLIGASYAVTLDMHMNYPVHIVLVGDKENEQIKRMLEASLHTYEPRKIVQVLDPKEDQLTIGDMTYDAEEEPMAYVCVQNVCREPVKESDELTVILEDVLGGTPS